MYRNFLILKFLISEFTKATIKIITLGFLAGYVSSLISAYILIIIWYGVLSLSGGGKEDILSEFMNIFTSLDLYLRCFEITLISIAGLIVFFGFIHPLASILFTALYGNILKYKIGKYFLTDALNDFLGNDNFFLKAVIIGIWVFFTQFIIGMITGGVYDPVKKKVEID